MGRGWQRTLLATMSLLVIPNLSITIYILCQCILCHYSFSPCFILYSSFLPLGTCTVTATDCICLLHCHGIYCTLCLICCVHVDNAIVGNEKEKECTNSSVFVFRWLKLLLWQCCVAWQHLIYSIIGSGQVCFDYITVLCVCLQQW